LHAQPVGVLQLLLAAMQVSPHALPVVQTRQHSRGVGSGVGVRVAVAVAAGVGVAVAVAVAVGLGVAVVAD